MIVDLNKLQEYFQYINEVNSAKLEDILWVENGAKVNIDPLKIEEYKFIGLSNKEFPFFMGWIGGD